MNAEMKQLVVVFYFQTSRPLLILLSPITL